MWGKFQKSTFVLYIDKQAKKKTRLQQIVQFLVIKNFGMTIK